MGRIEEQWRKGALSDEIPGDIVFADSSLLFVSCLDSECSWCTGIVVLVDRECTGEVDELSCDHHCQFVLCNWSENQRQRLGMEMRKRIAVN